MLFDRPFTFDRVIRIGIGIAILWGLFSLISYLSDVLFPFVVAVLLAYLLNPLVEWLQSRGRIKNRTLAVLLSLFIVCSVVLSLAILIVPVILDELTHMRSIVANVLYNAEIQNHAVRQIPDQVWEYLHRLIASEGFQRLLTFENIREVLRQVLPGVWGVFSGTISFLLSLFGLVIILLYLVFILVYYEEVSAGWKNLIPNPFRELVVGIFQDFTEAMRNYFRAQALVAFIVGVLHAGGFWLIDLPLGVLLGLFIGLLNMVPYLQIVGFIPAVLLAILSSLETGQGIWTMVLLVVLVFAVAQLIQDVVLVPRIMGDVTGFNPAVILLSISIWGKLLGMLGVVIALPITFLIHSYYKRYLTLARKRINAPEQS